MCKSWCELILAVIILVFALWQTSISQIVIVIAAVVLLIHSFTCKTCFAGKPMSAKSSRRR